MAARAAALAFEGRSAARRVASFDRSAVERVHVADERDDAGDFSGVEPEGLHTGAWNPGRDDPQEVLIGRPVPELPAAEVHSSDAVAVRAVARGALRVVQPRTVGDVGRTVYTRQRRGCGRRSRGVLGDDLRARDAESQDGEKQ